MFGKLDLLSGEKKFVYSCPSFVDGTFALKTLNGKRP